MCLLVLTMLTWIIVAIPHLLIIVIISHWIVNHFNTGQSDRIINFHPSLLKTLFALYCIIDLNICFSYSLAFWQLQRIPFFKKKQAYSTWSEMTAWHFYQNASPAVCVDPAPLRAASFSCGWESRFTGTVYQPCLSVYQPVHLKCKSTTRQLWGIPTVLKCWRTDDSNLSLYFAYCVFSSLVL